MTDTIEVKRMFDSDEDTAYSVRSAAAMLRVSIARGECLGHPQWVINLAEALDRHAETLERPRGAP